MPIVETLGCPVYLVTSNGGRIHSPAKELLFSFTIESEVIKKVLELDIDPEITTVLFKENVWLSNMENEKLKSFQMQMNYPNEIVDFNTLEDCSAIKFFFTHQHHQKLVALKDMILEQYSSDFHAAFSLPFCLEFMDKSVDKSVAIASVLERYKLTLEESMSFGDGFNDEKMLLSSGKGLIMANAAEGLKTKLSHLEVIESNEEDGVANYLSKNLLS